MKPEDVYDNVVVSLIKFVQEFIAEHDPTAVYVDWDAHAQISELPKDGTLIGPAGCGLSHEEVNREVVFGFGISTDQDPNLFRLRRLISKLYGRLQPAMTIPVYDHKTGEVASWMVLKTPVEIMPVTKAELRSVQFVNATALLNPAATSSR